jgi:hypothetical protein
MKSKLHRRDFIKNLLAAGGLSQFPFLLPNATAATTEYTGKLLVTVQMTGAWDVSSFCDPKVNVPGEREINHWARNDETRQVGNLHYAPFASNQKFFEKYYDRMLVINGVDAQSNAHETGVVVNWSGRTALGYPTLSSLFTATIAPEQPLGYVSFGGFSNTENIVRTTRINNPYDIKNILYPNNFEGQEETVFIKDRDISHLQKARSELTALLVQENKLMPNDLRNREYYVEALRQTDQLKAFGDLIPSREDIQEQTSPTQDNSNSTIFQQAQLALLAFKSGLSVAADLNDHGYDTHQSHDRNHEAILANTIDAVDYLWDYAEELGLADRLVVILGSDFSRTPYYNAGNGKDHWAIGSLVVMEKNARFTNRVIGETDGAQNAFKINPQTLQRDESSSGTIILPKHIHKAFRKYLGIDNTPLTEIFPFNGTEDFGFFS